MRLILTCCALAALFHNVLFAQYQLVPGANAVTDTQRQTERAFSDWRQRDESALKGTLTKTPAEAKRLIAAASDGAKLYVAAQSQYFEALRQDVLRDIAAVRDHDTGNVVRGISIRRDQIQREMISLLEEDRKIAVELKKLADSQDPKAAAIKGVLETEQQTARELRDNLTLQLGHLEAATATDSTRETSKRDLVKQFDDLARLYDDELKDTQGIGKALSDYYDSLQAFVDARATRAYNSSESKQPSETHHAASPFNGIWQYARAKGSSAPPSTITPFALRLSIRQLDDLFSGELAFWVKSSVTDATPDIKWSFAGRLIAAAPVFEFATPDGDQVRLQLELLKPNVVELRATMRSNGTQADKMIGPFRLEKVAAAQTVPRDTVKAIEKGKGPTPPTQK